MNTSKIDPKDLTIEYEPIVYPNAEPDPEPEPPDTSPEVDHLIVWDMEAEYKGWHGLLSGDRIMRIPLKLFSYENTPTVAGAQMKAEYLAALCWGFLSRGFRQVSGCPYDLSETDRRDIKALNMSIYWNYIKKDIIENKPVINDIIVVTDGSKAGMDRKAMPEYTRPIDLLWEMSPFQFIDDDRISLSIIRKE